MFADAVIDWPSIVEKGLTSAFFAFAFGMALWKIGNKLLDAHFLLVAEAHEKMASATKGIQDSDRKLDTVINELQIGNKLTSSLVKKFDSWPHNIEEICKHDKDSHDPKKNYGK